MLAHAVAVAVDVEHDASVQEAVEHGGRHHGVVEDLPPRAHAQICRQADAPAQVALGDDLEEGGGRLRGEREIADLVDLCRARHRSTYADHGTMPTRGTVEAVIPLTVAGFAGGVSGRESA